MTPSIGTPLSRVDGVAKVTGAARYAADVAVTGVAHAVIVGSFMARGTIESIDAKAAENAPGVLAVMTHANAPTLPAAATQKTTPGDRVLQILQDNRVRYSGQPVAVVVADTLEHAIAAAELVDIRYHAIAPATEMEAEMPAAFPHPLANGKPADSSRGSFDKGWSSAAARVSATYTTPVEHHNPMEMHGTVAVWQGPNLACQLDARASGRRVGARSGRARPGGPREATNQLTLYDATQGVFEVQRKAAVALGLKKENVRILSPFVGGGFGGKGSVWSHVVLAAMAAKHVGRPVKLTLTRMQMFDFVGHRPRTIQYVELGATANGVLTAVKHEGVSHTSRFDEFVEPVAVATRMLYACPNVATKHRLVRLDAGTPQFMRAPGESSGTFAIESAMDELAVALDMDPLRLRLLNYADRDQHDDKPFSSKSLRECYMRGAEHFGWSRRQATPRAVREDGMLVGLGMATAAYPVNRNPAGALARLLANGTAVVQSGSQDVGPGTYTVMTQIAADALGLPVGKVHFELGDTRMPPTPVSGGSMTTASTGSAVDAACRQLRRKLVRMAIETEGSTLRGVDERALKVEDGRVFSTNDPSKGETYVSLLGRAGLKQVEETAKSKPGAEKEKFSMHSFGAQFAEVHVDPETGAVRVKRWTGAFAVGKVLNAKLARSQFIGGVVWGIGMALTEGTVMDRKLGRFITRDLSDYHVPVNADVPDLEVLWVEEEDHDINPVGAKGIGELGLTGAAAAIANAIFNATGKRIRDLPITPDRVL